MRLAELAGLDPVTTMIEVEAGLDDRFGSIWQRMSNEWRARRDSNPRPLPSEGSYRKKAESVKTRGGAELHPANGPVQGARRFLWWLWMNVQGDPAHGTNPHQPSPAS